jgi:hypothetical protein
MKNKDFVVLCLRLLSIYLGVVGLSALPNICSFFIESFDSAPIYIAITPLIFIVCSLVLYFRAPNLSHFIVEFSNTEEENTMITTSEKTARIALLVLGIFIFVNALPQFIQMSIDVGLYYKKLGDIPKDIREVQNRWTYLIGPVIKIILSTVLIVGPDKVIGIVSKYDSTFKRLESSNKRIDR